MKVKWVSVFFFFGTVTLTVKAQESNDRCRWLSVFNQPVQLDTLTVVPGSISIDSSLISNFNYEPETRSVTVSPSTKMDSVRICYRVFPYNLYQEVKNRTLKDVVTKEPEKSDESNEFFIPDQREELFSSEKIYKSGAISRGISFGNRQDIFVNSVLNLQLEGKLSDHLNIRASITDQNIPYQPDGNTRLVQDFDNVFFEIYNDHFSVIGGDIVLNNRKSEFLRFQRNVQGALINVRNEWIRGSESNTSFAYSVSKGKFSSYQLEVLDGVMGPYKIYGPNHESFIIIIANSERVYLDGKLLQRGYDYDYVIDYNTGEITFTSRVLITKFSRINVDFEYTNQSYSRSVLNAAHTQKIGNHEISIQYYQEKDHQHQPLSFQLSDEEKFFLRDLDPGIVHEAVLPGWDSVGYQESRILYKRLDTLTEAGLRIPIFVASFDPDSAHYEVVFSETGWGNGDYIRKEAGLNGNIYEWAGVKMGNYQPVREVALPTLQQMVTMRSDIHTGKNTLVFNELAISSWDGNLFNHSLKNRSGFAWKTGFELMDQEIAFLPGYSISGHLDAEYDQKDFSPVDRFRYVEYDRDWSYNSSGDSLRASDKIINFSGSLRKDDRNHIDWHISRRIRKGMVDGWQGKTTSEFDFKHINVSGDLFLMKNDNDYFSSKWIRYIFQTHFKTKLFFPGYQYSVDHNRISPISSDSIVSSAMNYDEHQFFIRNNDTLNTRFNLSYSIRKDRVPRFGELKDYNLSRTTQFLVGTQRGKLGKLDFSTIYRQLVYLEDSAGQHENSLIGRTDWRIDLMKGHIRSEFSYSMGNSRELRREYIYIQVPTGEGTHTWRDNNQDGIQDLNEFYLAVNPDERNFIKLFTPTDDYVLAYDNHLIYRLSAEMPHSWKNKSGIKDILARFSNILYINLKQKISQDEFWDNLLFRGRRDTDGRLLSYRKNIRNTLQFNRANPNFGMDLVYQLMNNKQLISNGFEARDQEQLKLVSRIHIGGDYNLRINWVESGLKSGSDFLEGRNFRVRGDEYRTTLEWQPSNFLRFSTDYAFARNWEAEVSDAVYGISKIHESLINVKYARASKKNIDFTFRYTHIDFKGEENTALGYELLKGLKPGTNLTWSLIWQQKIMNGLQMNLSYEGRKSGTLDTIHVGRMQIMALF